MRKLLFALVLVLSVAGSSAQENGIQTLFGSGLNTSTLTVANFSGPGAFLGFKFGWFQPVIDAPSLFVIRAGNPAQSLF